MFPGKHCSVFYNKSLLFRGKIRRKSPPSPPNPPYPPIFRWCVEGFVLCGLVKCWIIGVYVFFIGVYIPLFWYSLQSPSGRSRFYHILMGILLLNFTIRGCKSRKNQTQRHGVTEVIIDNNKNKNLCVSVTLCLNYFCNTTLPLLYKIK